MEHSAKRDPCPPKLRSEIVNMDPNQPDAAAADAPIDDEEYTAGDVLRPAWRLDPEMSGTEECRHLSMETFARQSSTAEVWRAQPPQKWAKAAVFFRDRLVLWPRYSNPHAQRYLTPRHGSIKMVIVLHSREYPLPNDANEALVQLSSRLSASIYTVHDTGEACLSDELSEVWRSLTGRVKVMTVAVEGEPRFEEAIGGHFTISASDLDVLRRTLNRAEYRKRERIREVKRYVVFRDVTSRLFPGRIAFVNEPTPDVILGDASRTRRLPTRTERLEGRATLRALRDSLEVVAADSTVALVELRAEIERVTLAEMIRRFDELLAQDHPESRWQAFFEENIFVLTLAFARPVRLLHTQFHAQPSNTSGTGAQIGDFLLRGQGQGLAIVEIKKPTTDLLHSRPYRNTQVFAPSFELAGAINQTLHQQAVLRSHWLHHQTDQTLRQSMPDSVKCVVIAGRLPTQAAELRSFEIMRSGYKDIEVITFDELGAKLRLVLELLNAGAPASALLAPVAHPAADASPDASGDPA